MMKLLFCCNCHDMFKLSYEMRTCGCGKSKGKYKEDGRCAMIYGHWAVPVGIDNHIFLPIAQGRMDGRDGGIFRAWIFDPDYKRIEHIVEEE